MLFLNVLVSVSFSDFFFTLPRRPFDIAQRTLQDFFVISLTVLIADRVNNNNACELPVKNRATLLTQGKCTFLVHVVARTFRKLLCKPLCRSYTPPKCMTEGTLHSYCICILISNVDVWSVCKDTELSVLCFRFILDYIKTLKPSCFIARWSVEANVSDICFL